MNIVPRSFSSPTDIQSMIVLAQEFPESHLHTVDLPYRLSSWGVDYPENVRLWEDKNGLLAGWAVLQPPFWTIDFACHPEAGIRLFREILAWADRRAGQILGTPSGHPTWYVNVFAGQAGYIQVLEEAGFVSQAEMGEDSWTKVLMRRPAQDPIKPYLAPAGFTVRPLSGEAEVPAYVKLHQAVFETRNMTEEWRTRSLCHPDYTPDLDVVVEAPDGRLAAFCVGWLAHKTSSRPIGQIEPLGCHKDYRRFALGRVALVEVLRRMQSFGLASILVETDNYRNTALALYESLGFRVTQDVLVFRKDYGE